MDAANGVCIVGAGISGIATARALAFHGLAYECFDRHKQIGGRCGAPGESTFYTSREHTQFWDWPMPSCYPQFPQGSHIAVYLRNYADRFGLRKHIHLGTEVTQAVCTPGGTWKVTLDGGAQRHFSALVVATGRRSVRRALDPAPIGEFFGEQCHADEICNRAAFRDRDVVVVGSGQRASDIAVEASYIARSTRLCTRNPRYVLPPIVMGRPYDLLPGLQYLLGKRIGASPVSLQLPRWIRRRTLAAALGASTSLALHGLPRPDLPPGKAETIVAPQLLERLLHGRIEVGPALERLEGDHVRLADGRRARAETIVWCSGHNAAFPFLAEGLAPDGLNGPGLFRNVLLPGVPNLAFVGLVEATTGSLTRIVVSQAEWVAAQLGGRCAPPPERRMRAQVRSARGGAATAGRPFAVEEGEYTWHLRRELRTGCRRARRRRPAAAYGATEKVG